MSEDEFKILKTLKLPLTIAIHYQNLSSGKNKCLAQKLFGLKKNASFFWNAHPTTFFPCHNGCGIKEMNLKFRQIFVLFFL